MGDFQIEYDELKIYCLESCDGQNWFECDITKEEAQLLKDNKISAYSMFNDGRKVY